MKQLLLVGYLLALSTLGFAQTNKGTITTPDAQLSQEELAAFHERCRQVVEEFQQYLPTIADKNSSDIEKEDAINAAKALFIEGSMIQISSTKSKEVKTIPIGDYLRAISILKQYNQVKITFYDLCKVSQFTQDPEGNYRGNAKIFQRFTGYDKNGRPIYDDMTTKSISTSINPSFDPFYQKNKWKVFLGNITVEETIAAPQN